MRSNIVYIHQKKYFLFLFTILLGITGNLLVACGAKQQPAMNNLPSIPVSTNTPTISTVDQVTPSPSIAPSSDPVQLDATLIPTIDTPQPGATTSVPTQRPTLEPDAWMSLPIVPTVSDISRQIFQRGLSVGRNPHAFSKIGDCQSITTYFLALFDKPGYYQLGDQTYLQDTIDWFSGSFQRESLAVKGGLNAAAMLSPLRADPKACQTGESPLACELRLNNPSLAIISLEEWWADDPAKYERYMRQIIEYTLSQDILPILATKADNLEGNYLINQTIAQLAWEYDLPLWNFWLAVQPLPNHGLMEKSPDGKPDMFHLTHSNNFYNFTDLQALQSGWAMRNLTALQVLDAVQRALNESALP